MPRAAIISWNKEKGVVVLSAGPNRFYLDHHSDDPIKNGENYVKLCKYLQALSPILPPDNLPYESGPVPEVTEEELARATRFTYPATAKGIRNKATTVSREELLNLIDELSEEKKE